MSLSAGLSSSLTDQLQQVLDVVGTGLQGVRLSHLASIERRVRRAAREERERVEEGWRRERVRKGIWHDGRLDCVAGNGIMCELGIGDEMMGEEDEEVGSVVGAESGSINVDGENIEEILRKQRSMKDLQAIVSLPVVVIRNYATNGGSGREELLGVLAQWAATLAENQVCQG